MNAAFDISGITINTDRLKLRPFLIDDLEDLFLYASIPGVGESAGWQHHKNKEESMLVLKMFIEGKKTFAIEYNSKVIGSIGVEKLDQMYIRDMPEKDGREIGYVLSKDFWGKGLMNEAVKAVIDYLFKVLNYDFLTCAHFIENDKSRRVIEKCGFKYYADLIFHGVIGDFKAKSYILYNSNRFTW